jgi:CheY-like chemotaxis protein
MMSTSAHPGATSHATSAATGLQRVPGAAESELVPTAGELPAEDEHEDPRLTGEQPISGPRPVTVLLYSDDVDTRAQVRMALGKRIATDLPPLEWTEVATPPAVISAVDSTTFDVLILDGEASPAGGLGICKQLKDEKYECPPVLVLTGRPQDAWLAAWSRADAAVPHPLDPRALSEAVAGLARRRRG